MTLTDEQRKRMEENKAKALAKKAERERAKLLEAAAAQLEQDEQNHEVEHFQSFVRADF